MSFVNDAIGIETQPESSHVFVNILFYNRIKVVFEQHSYIVVYRFVILNFAVEEALLDLTQTYFRVPGARPPELPA